MKSGGNEGYPGPARVVRRGAYQGRLAELHDRMLDAGHFHLWIDADAWNRSLSVRFDDKARLLQYLEPVMGPIAWEA